MRHTLFSVVLGLTIIPGESVAQTANDPLVAFAQAMQQTTDPLATLEQALRAQPDDLRVGNEYRMAVVRTGQYDRGLAFFQRLLAANPWAANAHLNCGFAYVDKIPVAGAITQVILANNA